MEDNVFITLLKPEYFVVTAVIVIVCVFSTWFLVALWTLNDAKKRYNNIYIAMFFGLFVLPFNLPGFIFYIVIRPELAEENVYYMHHEEQERAVNIPIARFEGENGFKLTINLDITKPVVTSEGDINVKVDMKENDRIQFIQKEEVVRSDDRDDSAPAVRKENAVTKVADKVKSAFGSLKGRVSKLATGMKSYSAKLDVEEEVETPVTEEVVNIEVTAEPTEESVVEVKEENNEENQEKKSNKQK